MPRYGERLAHPAWSAIAEPGDRAAGEVICQMGAPEAFEWLSYWAEHPSGLAPATRRCVDRWAPRLERVNPERSLENFSKIGGHLIIPSDDQWPHGLNDLGESAPTGLWVRGTAQLHGIAVVGSRAATRYGETVAVDLGAGISSRGIPVVSGGAYGIDASAHRGPLTEGVTIAVLAGGADSLYPAGNAELLAQISKEGALVAEMPPGSAPSRHRFLARNRLIAAMTSATIVVEASARSGAISTANHARDLLRPLGAVPGPVTSMASRGCHTLIRDGATCVTTVEEALELAAPIGSVMPSSGPVQPGLLDDLDPFSSRVLDSMPSRAATDVDSLTRVSGLSAREVLQGLGTLKCTGRVSNVGHRWIRVRF